IAGTFSQRRDSAEALGLRLASAVGVTGIDAGALARLRTVSADTIVAAAVKLAGSPGRPIFWPLVDGWVLPQPADSALATGAANVVPVIVGSNGDESQEVFGAPSRSFARLITSHGQPAYLYQFTRVADDSVNRKAGAYHSMLIEALERYHHHYGKSLKVE